MKSRFGETAMHEGLLNRGQVDTLLSEQEAATPELADCILDLGFLDRHVLDREQRNYETSMQLVRGQPALAGASKS
jgi:hypothetical protein